MSASSIGRYEVIGELASGGMAQVLLARHVGVEGFQKVVALKRILPHVARDPVVMRMFLDEARLAAQLDHPNLVQVHDIGRAGEDYFFTMEYVHGETLHAILAASTAGLPLRHAIFVAAEIAAGLQHAHERFGFDGRPLALVHRDVTPSNILVSREGAVKLADFGIAKSAISIAETTFEIRKGKTAYMSPEQCLGEPLDRRSDVWSLGVVLYEMTTGERPFRGDTEFTLMRRIVEDRPEPPSGIVAGYPEALETVVMRALQRDRDLRTPDARTLRRELLAATRSSSLHSSAEELTAAVDELLGARPPAWAGRALEEAPSAALPITAAIAHS